MTPMAPLPATQSGRALPAVIELASTAADEKKHGVATSRLVAMLAQQRPSPTKAMNREEAGEPASIEDVARLGRAQQQQVVQVFPGEGAACAQVVASDAMPDTDEIASPDGATAAAARLFARAASRERVDVASRSAMDPRELVPSATVVDVGKADRATLMRYYHVGAGHRALLGLPSNVRSQSVSASSRSGDNGASRMTVHSVPPTDRPSSSRAPAPAVTPSGLHQDEGKAAARFIQVDPRLQLGADASAASRLRSSQLPEWVAARVAAGTAHLIQPTGV